MLFLPISILFILPYTMALVESKQKEQGREAPDFDLLGTDEEQYTLKDFMFNQWICIVFTCNHCPYAKASWAPLIELAYKYPSLAFIAINSNDAKAYPEDDFAHMQKTHRMYGLPFAYLHDVSQSVAKAYDAQCTPDIYLFKNTQWVFNLFYQWRINDNWQDPTMVKEKDLERHCAKLISGEQPDTIQVPSMWCSIKWK